MRTIYNEGRVVGASAYEIYVRQVLADNPDAKVVSEREWIASSLSGNNAMVLKIAAGTTAGYHDYILPPNSQLCGCSTVFASIFEGLPGGLDNEFGVWATEILDYGRLIENTNDSHPETPGEPENVPTKENPGDIPQQFKQQCIDYCKINSGLVIQPGEWAPYIYLTELTNESDINVLTQSGAELLAEMKRHGIEKIDIPDFSRRGFVRLAFAEDITSDVYILLYGFYYKNKIEGSTGFFRPDVEGHPENGDFLGPVSFPWGCKVVMTVDSAVVSTVLGTLESAIWDKFNQVDNSIESIDNSIESIDNSIIDMKETFQDGVDTIYSAVRRNGVTPSSSTPTDCAAGIDKLRVTPYTATYTARERGVIDLGVPHSVRYLDTSYVPNYNTQTYSYPSGSNGATVDLGQTNTYRYVNAQNVYQKGIQDQQAVTWEEVLPLRWSLNPTPHSGEDTASTSVTYVIDVSTIAHIRGYISGQVGRAECKLLYWFSDSQSSGVASLNPLDGQVTITARYMHIIATLKANEETGDTIYAEATIIITRQTAQLTEYPRR